MMNDLTFSTPDMRAEARLALRQWLAADDATVLARVDALGRQAIAAAAEASARLDRGVTASRSAQASLSALQALIARETNMGFIDTVTAIPHIQSGDLRALAVTSIGRSPQMPQVPTLAEAGLTGYRATNDFGFFAPAGTPPAIVEQLSAAARDILAMPEVKARLDAASIDIYAGTSEAFPPYQTEEAQRWGNLIRRRNIKME